MNRGWIEGISLHHWISGRELRSEDVLFVTLKHTLMLLEMPGAQSELTKHIQV